MEILIQKDSRTGYNSQLNNLWALAESGAIANAEKAKKFRDEYGFWGEDAGKYDQGSKSAYNSFAVDDIESTIRQPDHFMDWM